MIWSADGTATHRLAQSLHQPLHLAAGACPNTLVRLRAGF